MMRFTMWGFCRVKSCSGEIGRGSVERRVGRGKGVPRRAERGGLPPPLTYPSVYPSDLPPYVGVRSAAAGGTDRRACSSLICTEFILHIRFNSKLRARDFLLAPRPRGARKRNCRNSRRRTVAVHRHNHKVTLTVTFSYEKASTFTVGSAPVCRCYCRRRRCGCWSR